MSNSQDARPGDTEHNKAKESGETTQRNEPQRTPASRSDRESNLGSGNQSQSRQGNAGSGAR